jgi:hypothetical protein
MPLNGKIMNTEPNKADEKIVQSILRTIDQYKQNKITLDRLMEGLDEAYSLESIDLEWSEKFEEYWDALDQIIDEIELSCDIEKTRPTPMATPQEQQRIHAVLDKIAELMKLV